MLTTSFAIWRLTIKMINSEKLWDMNVGIERHQIIAESGNQTLETITSSLILLTADHNG